MISVILGINPDKLVTLPNMASSYFLEVVVVLLLSLYLVPSFSKV